MKAGFWGLLYDSSKAACRPSISWALSVSEWEGWEISSLALKNLLPQSPFLLPVNSDAGPSQRWKGKPHPPPFQRVLEFWKQPSNELCFQPFQKRGALLRDQLSDRVSALDEAASPAFLSLKTEVGELICTTANLATFDRDKPIQQLQSGCNEVRGNPHYFTQVAQTRSSTWQLPSNCPLQRQVSLPYKEWFQCRP